MNLVIKNVNPEARGLLYRLQGENSFDNLAAAFEFVMKSHYNIKID